jgi:hypothetical protein
MTTGSKARNYLSWPGMAAPAVGEVLRYRATASPHDCVVLDLPFGAAVLALDWFTDDAPDGQLVLHQLTVPSAVATRIGLAFEAVVGVDAVVAAAEDGGYTLIAGRVNSCCRGADAQIAAALGAVGAANLWTCWQVVLARHGKAGEPGAPFPLFLEWTYTA